MTIEAQSFAENLNTEEIALSSLLQYLKKDRQVTFLYEPETINNVFVKSDFSPTASIKTILKKVLPQVGLKFQKVGQYNFVIKKSRKFYKKGRKHYNQKPHHKISTKKTKAPSTRMLTGVLRSAEDEETLIGATIRVKGTTFGTTTDIDGTYGLEIPIGKQTLIFSYVGFEEKEVVIDNEKKQNVRLKVAATDLNEVIVMAMGIEGNKRILGYAADNFQIANLHQSNESNLVNILVGQSAGVWVNSASGSPGASSSIFIRGLRSVNGSNKPLFILDGIPVDNTTTGNGTGGVDVSNRLIDLNPYDIEKMTILKGAAATALYGIRAANGAIIMTSKKGQKGQPKVNFSTSFGLNQVNKLPARQQLYAQGKFKNGVATYLGPASNTASSYGAAIADLEFDGNPNYPYDQNGNLVQRYSC